VIAPPGVLVDVGGGRRLHVHEMGAGSPTVLFDAGISASCLSWTHVQPRVAAFARTFSYDRMGLAWSDPCPGPVTAKACADDLAAMIRAASIPMPAIFVGHSYAAFVLQAYAAAHPESVAGIVLVDPIYPSEWLNLTREGRFRLRGGVFLSRVGALLARAGVVGYCLDKLATGSTGVPVAASRMFGSEAKRTLDRLVGEVQKLPREVWPAVQSHWSQPKSFISMARHLSGLRESAAQVAAAPISRQIPVAIISAATQTPEYRRAQTELATRSTHGRVIIANRSGHWAHLDEPQLIVDAIRELMVRRSPTEGRGSGSVS